MRAGRLAVLSASLFVLFASSAASALRAQDPPAKPVAPAPQAAAATQAPEPKVETAMIRGAELAYMQAGKGDAVVFVHGSLSDLNTFRPQFDAFAKQFRVIAYSRRYHPPNQPPAKDSVYSAALHAEDLAALIDKLGLSKPHLVASSYGAYTSLLFALKRQNAVRSLVLGEPPAFPLVWKSPVGEPLFKAFEEGALKPSRRAFERGDLEDGLRQFLEGVTGAKGLFDQIPAPGRAELLTYGLVMQREMLTDPAQYFPAVSCEDLKALKVPTLLVSGGQSARFFHAITDELARCLPKHERIEIPDAGHSMHRDDPATYNDKVLKFLAAH